MWWPAERQLSSVIGSLGQFLKVRAANLPHHGQRIVVGVHAGGLGDNLAYSVLPRLYKQAGARKVLISTHTNFGEPLTRNGDVRELVWRLNPFVDGFTEERPNVGERDWPPNSYFA